MNYDIVPIDRFKKEAKKLIKKYPSLKSEILKLENVLTINPSIGVPLGNNVYKIRLAIESKGRGKSGGARVITYLINENREVYLLSIYDKSEYDAIDDNTIRNIVEKIIKNRK